MTAIDELIDSLPEPVRHYPVAVERTYRFVVMVSEADSLADAVAIVDDQSHEFVGSDDDPIDAWDSVEAADVHDLAIYFGDRIGPLDCCRECHGPAADLHSHHVNHAPTCSQYRHYMNLDAPFGPESSYRVRCSCRHADMATAIEVEDHDEALALAEAHAADKELVNWGFGFRARPTATVSTGGLP